VSFATRGLSNERRAGEARERAAVLAKNSRSSSSSAARSAEEHLSMVAVMVASVQP
jgi:hypothetical protein